MQIEYTVSKNRQTLVSQSHGVMIVVYRIYTTAFTPRYWRQGGCSVTTQGHVVQINQSENRNSYSVWKLNNKNHYSFPLNALHLPMPITHATTFHSKTISDNKQEGEAHKCGKPVMASWERMYCTQAKAWSKYLKRLDSTLYWISILNRVCKYSRYFQYPWKTL